MPPAATLESTKKGDRASHARIAPLSACRSFAREDTSRDNRKQLVGLFTEDDPHHVLVEGQAVGQLPHRHRCLLDRHEAHGVGMPGGPGGGIRHLPHRRSRTIGHVEDLATEAGPGEAHVGVGQIVHVQTWNPDGTARVAYRGTLWDAELATSATPHADTLYIVATRGSVLVLSDRPPAA